MVVDRAEWFSVSVTLDDAPVWLIPDTSDGKIGWCRMPDGPCSPQYVDEVDVRSGGDPPPG